MTEVKFFVYGSLSEGFVHFEKIKKFIKDSQPAYILGTAYRLKVGYPVVMSSGSDKVFGHLLSVEANDTLINILDEMHGYSSLDEAKSLFCRAEVEVSSEQGTVKAWTYFLNPLKLPTTAQRIEGGDWKASLAQSPALTEKLSERQRAYILRLGASSGREIVPIDLALYRELMNLEMIVDKGRRLALSKLGHEVFRYLT